MYDFLFLDGDEAERPVGSEYISHSSSDPQLQDMYYSESLEESVSEINVKDLKLPFSWL